MSEMNGMDRMPYGVYVRVDEIGRITAINSSAFLTDVDSWMKIDEGLGDMYHHAQGNYLDKPIRDERGVCQYKLADGQAVERTQTEMDADFAALPVPEPTAEELLLEMAGDHEYRLCLIELGVSGSDL